MAFHLRAKAEEKASVGELLQVPGELCGDHRASREGDGNGGAERELRRVLAGEQQRQERVVAGLGRQHAVVAETLGVGNVSLALRLSYRAPDRTLTDEEVARRREAIASALAQELGGRVRAA